MHRDDWISPVYQTGYDVIKDLCSEMDISGEDECNEFGLFTFLERGKSYSMFIEHSNFEQM